MMLFGHTLGRLLAQEPVQNLAGGCLELLPMLISLPHSPPMLLLFIKAAVLLGSVLCCLRKHLNFFISILKWAERGHKHEKSRRLQWKPLCRLLSFPSKVFPLLHKRKWKELVLSFSGKSGVNMPNGEWFEREDTGFGVFMVSHRGASQRDVHGLKSLRVFSTKGKVSACS